MAFEIIGKIVKTATLAAAFVAAFAVYSADPGRAADVPVSRLVNVENFAPQPARRWRAYNRRSKYQDFKVFAVSDDGRAYGMAWSFLSPEWAVRTALQRCEEKRREDTLDCAVFAMGRQVMVGRSVATVTAEYAQRMRGQYGAAGPVGASVTERKLETHVTYRSFAGKTRWGTDFKLRFRKGEVQFEQGWIAGVMGKGQMGVARWAVENGQLCFHLSKSDTPPLCYKVTEVGDDDAYQLVDDQGDVVATLTP